MTDTASQVYAVEAKSEVTIQNKGTNSVFLGSSDAVTDSTGFELANGDSVTLRMRSYEAIYGVCAAAETATLHVLASSIF